MSVINKDITAIVFAADYQFIEWVIVLELLKKEEMGFTSTWMQGHDILIRAIMRGQLEVIRALLKRDSVDVNGKTAGGTIALLCVSSCGYVDGLRELLK